MREFILELKKQKKTIFLNTHNLDEAQRICDRIGILNTRLMAVGTPEELERSVHGRKTVIQLRQVSEAILDSLKRLQVKNLVREGNKLTVDVMNPAEENPDMVSAIVAAGGRIETVTVTSSSLEDAYLKLVRGTHNDHLDAVEDSAQRVEGDPQKEEASSSIPLGFLFSSPFFSHSSSRTK